jgi:hypothetical protein
MKFKNLTDEEINSIKEQYYNRVSLNLTVEKLAIKLGDEYGVTERTMRKWFVKLDFKEKTDIEPEQYLKAKSRVHDNTKKRFIISFAQNNTSTHPSFLKNIEAYAEHINADIHIIAGRYKNPTSMWTQNQQSEEKWDDKIIKYLDANRHDIHEYVSILSDIKIQPTAVNPMVGLQALSGVNSCIFGSPKVQLEMIPVLEGCKPKMMLTTGAITKKNYTDSKAGKTGDFHHTFGFVIVEIKDDETFFVRQVTADDKTGDFTDLYYNVSKGVVSKIDKIEGIVLGDLHIGHHDEVVLSKTIELMDNLKPKHVVLHDVFDGDSISHHQMKDPFIQYGKEVQGTNDLGKEINCMLEQLNRFTKFENVVIVRSNHDDFVDRWLKNEDWKKQPTFKNAPLYMDLSARLLRQYSTGFDDVKGVIPELINDKFPNFITLGRSSSYKIKGWECGAHGDSGSNGSRGSLLQFRKLNTKIIVGHYHCLPAEYKVQTKDNGWKEIRAIKQGDIILSYDSITNKNVWNVVNEFIESDYNGVMLQISGNGFEQTFTDKHMLMLRDGSYIPASEAICTRSSSELPLSALPEDTFGISIPEKVIRQIVAIAADGSQDKYRIRFHLKKKRKIDRLKDFFGDDLKIYTDEENNFDGYISTRGETFKNLMKYKYNIKTVKNISVEILEWDYKSLEILIDELKFWDGTYDTGNNGNQYSTSNKVECSVISSALNRLGYSHTVNKREYENENHKTSNVITWCSDRDFNRSSKKMNHDVRFNGWGFNTYQSNTKVYCVSVENKCFWVQSAKTGQVSLTGNSPGRKDGAIAVGTSTKLRVGYNVGPSSWFQSHVIIHKDGRAQHINFVKDKNGEMGYTTLT